MTEIATIGLAALERLAPVARRRPRGQDRLLTITLEVELLARLSTAAQNLDTSRAALLEALIAARLNGEI